jgi:hypothetical protein
LFVVEAAMQFQFDISTAAQPKPATAPGTSEALADLVRQLIDLQRDGFSQLLEVQREHLAHARHVHQENMQRWRNLLGRWDKEFPSLAAECKQVYPHLERAYLNLVQTMVHDLIEQGDEGFESDFALQDFIDRHGMRAGQLGHILGVIGPLSEAGNTQNEAPGGT